MYKIIILKVILLTTMLALGTNVFAQTPPPLPTGKEAESFNKTYIEFQTVNPKYWYVIKNDYGQILGTVKPGAPVKVENLVINQGYYVHITYLKKGVVKGGMNNLNVPVFDGPTTVKMGPKNKYVFSVSKKLQ